MQQIEFIKRNIMNELMRQGASPGNAEQAADFAVLEYKRRTDLGKDTMGELLRIAGVMAKKYDNEFNFVQPKPKVYRRVKS